MQNVGVGPFLFASSWEGPSDFLGFQTEADGHAVFSH